MKTIDVKYTKEFSDASAPVYSTPLAAGADLKAYCPEEDIVIRPDTNELIHTGIHAAIPDGYFGAIFARSGMATKRGLRPANCVGVIDGDFRGEIMVPLYNDSDVPATIRHDDRIAQLVFIPYAQATLKEIETLDDTERGAGGFGSTGA